MPDFFQITIVYTTQKESRYRLKNCRVNGTIHMSSHGTWIVGHVISPAHEPIATLCPSVSHALITI